MTKPESLDCVAVKRRAQRALAKALAGKSPDEQAKIASPTWPPRRRSGRSSSKARAERPRKTVRTPGKRRSTG